MIDDFTLQYPGEIAPRIGLHVNQINVLKRRGCKFYGRKTCVAWVREHLNRVTESETEQPEHLPRSVGNKSGELTAKNG